MISGMLSDKVDDRHLGPARVVQIGEAIAETGAKMQECARRFFGQARISVGGAGDDTFEEAKHATYFRHSVKRSDQMNLRGAGVGEARPNSTCYQGANQTFCAIHLIRGGVLSASPLDLRPKKKSGSGSDVSKSILFQFFV
jgi:hypothetical protein